MEGDRRDGISQKDRLAEADLLQLLNAIRDCTIAELQERYPNLSNRDMQLLMELRAGD